MRTRKLGATSLNLSTVGLGTWPMGSVYGGMTWGPQDDQASINTVIRAVARGINWLDTAPAYGRGHSEKILGMAFKQLPTRPLVVTKCGSTWDETGKAAFRLDRASIRTQCEASLKRMDIDTIDLYLVHWPNPIEYMEEGWQTCSDLVKEGKLRYIGVSNFTIEQMDKLQPIHPIAAMEPPYSMLERRIETGILEYCRKHNMGVIIYSPLQQGLLTGTIKVDDLAPNDFRRANPHFREPELSLNLKLAEDLAPIAARNKCSIAQLAIAWTLRKPEVTAALNGARDPSEIEDSVKASDITIPQADIDEIEKLLNERQQKVPPPPPPGGPTGGAPGGPPGMPPGR